MTLIASVTGHIETAQAEGNSQRGHTVGLIYSAKTKAMALPSPNFSFLRGWFYYSFMATKQELIPTVVNLLLNMCLLFTCEADGDMIVCAQIIEGMLGGLLVGRLIGW